MKADQVWLRPEHVNNVGDPWYLIRPVYYYKPEPHDIDKKNEKGRYDIMISDSIIKLESVIQSLLQFSRNTSKIVVEEEIITGDIEVGVDTVNGAIYDIATNETTLYVPNVPDTTVDGRVALRYGMWENIRTGKFQKVFHILMV